MKKTNVVLISSTKNTSQTLRNTAHTRENIHLKGKRIMRIGRRKEMNINVHNMLYDVDAKNLDLKEICM